MTPRLRTDRARTVLATALADAGVSARELAEALDVSSTIVDRWLNGHTHIPLEIIAHPALPLPVRTRIAAELLGPPPAPGPRPARDSQLETALLLRANGETTKQLAESLMDPTTPLRIVRDSVVALRDRCEKWLRVHAVRAREVAA